MKCILLRFLSVVTIAFVSAAEGQILFPLSECALFEHHVSAVATVDFGSDGKFETRIDVTCPVEKADNAQIIRIGGQ